MQNGGLTIHIPSILGFLHTLQASNSSSRFSSLGRERERRGDFYATFSSPNMQTMYLTSAYTILSELHVHTSLYKNKSFSQSMYLIRSERYIHTYYRCNWNLSKVRIFEKTLEDTQNTKLSLSFKLLNIFLKKLRAYIFHLGIEDIN